jgi:uncharacterized coiled-coil protein SlyX
MIKMNEKETRTLLARVIELESTTGLLQRDIDRQSEATLLITRRMGEIEKALAGLHRQLEMLVASQQTPLPPSEKPPHY